jgi:hypothetical protein
VKDVKDLLGPPTRTRRQISQAFLSEAPFAWSQLLELGFELAPQLCVLRPPPSRALCPTLR